MGTLPLKLGAGSVPVVGVAAVEAKTRTGEMKSTLRHKETSIPLKEGSLVVVFEGLQRIEDGPHAGETTVGSAKVYLGAEQVGLLQHFKLELHANEVFPRLDFDFGSMGPDPAPTDTKSVERFLELRQTYSHFIDRVKKWFPWARWKSPVGNSVDPEGEINVLDPGLIRPTTPRSGGGL